MARRRNFLVGLRVMPETESVALWGGPANSTLGLAVLTRDRPKACADVAGLGKALVLCLGVDDLAFAHREASGRRPSPPSPRSFEQGIVR